MFEIAEFKEAQKGFYPHVLSLHMTWLECKFQPSESKFLVKVAHAKYQKCKCNIKLCKLEIEHGYPS